MTVIARLLSLFVVPEREHLRNLLVPELADLRQQLECSRQRRESEHAAMRPSVLLAERDQLNADNEALRARVAELEAGKHRLEIELAEAREANEALAFDKAKQVNPYDGGLRYRRLSDELIIRDDGYRIEYQLADSRNVKPSDWELWAEYKQSNYTGSEIADALMGHKETP